MRKKLTGKFLSVIIAVALLMTLVPLVSAFEAHMINVRVHVKDRLHFAKTIELASPGDVQGLIDQGLLPPGADPDQPFVDPDYPYEVPTFTCVVWLVRISLANTDNYCWTEVVVKDNFSAEVGGVPLDEEPPVDVIVRTQTRGNSKKESFESQTRIVWYVTCKDWDPVTEECNDNSGLLCPGESVNLDMLVWTKLNPSGKQSYTSPGTYTLNSGPTAKWLDPDGHQTSLEAQPIYVCAY